MDIKNVLSVTKISEEKIFIDILIQITNSLFQLNTMKIHSLSLDQPTDSETEEFIIFPSTKSTNQITKVYLEKMFAIEEVYSLMKLCPYMSCLKINSFDNMNVVVFVRNILEKIHRDSNQYLRLPCFCAPAAADDSMIKILEKMKNDEKWIDNYTIKRVDDHIYLQWK
jgi:hypothetical protein